jgi:predicted flap endonuclease-1-like 5' DNA nuclease
MIYDSSFLWIWLSLAFLLGAVVGWWMEVSGAQAPWFFGWFRNAVIAWLVGLVVAWLHWLPGRLGFWLETALLFFAFYVLGCLLGGLLRSFFATPETAGGLIPARQWPFRVGEGASPLVGHGASATPIAVAAVAPRASTVISDELAAPRSARVLSDDVVVPRATAVVSEPEPAATGTIHVTVVPEDGTEAEDLGAGSHAMTVVSDSAPGGSGITATARVTIEVEPAKIGPIEGEELHEGERPYGLVSPRGGVPDDLKRIRGIGHQNEGRLHALGIWHFQQIAHWTAENVRWVGSYLAFPGRIDREDWIGQARLLNQGLETEFSRRVERGEVATSRDDGTEGQGNIADVSKPKPNH